MKVGKGAKWSTFNGSWKAFSLLRPEKMHRKTAFCSSPSFATLLLLLLVLHRISMSITIEKLTGISDAFFRTMSSSLLEILKVFFAYKMTQKCKNVSNNEKYPKIGTTMLVAARKLATSWGILLWMTRSETPKALHASECSELCDPMRASCWISAQH